MPERLDRARAPVLGIRLVAVQAIDVEAGDVDVGPAVDDPVREHAAEAAAGEDADRVEAGGDEVVLELGRLADDRRRSGVKLSGPQKNLRTPVSSEIGTRCIAFSTYGPMRSQSGGISPNEKSSGTPSTFHGAQTGSNRPIIRPPTSSRK